MPKVPLLLWEFNVISFQLLILTVMGELKIIRDIDFLIALFIDISHVWNIIFAIDILSFLNPTIMLYAFSFQYRWKRV